ncbi:hypothetical protein QQ045_023724 [Rhodiola kirilowii]
MGFLALTMLLGIIFASVAYSQIDQCNTAADPFDCREFRNLTYPFWKRSTDQEPCIRNEEFELLNCDNEPEFLSVLINDQTFRVKNISLEKKTMTLSPPFDSPCVQEKSPGNANMSQVLPHIYIFFGCDPRKDVPELHKLHCGLDDWMYWGSEMYPTPKIVESCKIQFFFMNGTTLDDIRSSNDSHHLCYELLTSLRTEFKVYITMPPPPPKPGKGKLATNFLCVIFSCFVKLFSAPPGCG